MAATPENVGTSPEVLQHYLTAGIDLESDRKVRRRLVSLFRGGMAHVDKMNGSEIELGNLSIELKYWLPVLRPFSQLCTPLEDGAIAAVEVAKLARSHNQGSRACATERFQLGYEDPEDAHEDELWISNAGLWPSGEGVVITPDWEVFAATYHWEGANDLLAIYDYLRSKHFALPVNGRPLVEGVDYIAKSPASTTTEEKTPAAPNS